MNLGHTSQCSQYYPGGPRSAETESHQLGGNGERKKLAEWGISRSLCCGPPSHKIPTFYPCRGLKVEVKTQNRTGTQLELLLQDSTLQLRKISRESSSEKVDDQSEEIMREGEGWE